MGGKVTGKMPEAMKKEGVSVLSKPSRIKWSSLLSKPQIVILLFKETGRTKSAYIPDTKVPRASRTSSTTMKHRARRSKNGLEYSPEVEQTVFLYMGGTLFICNYLII